MFMTVKQAAEKWGVSDGRIRILCAEGKIPGAEQDLSFSGNFFAQTVTGSNLRNKHPNIERNDETFIL